MVPISEPDDAVEPDDPGAGARASADSGAGAKAAVAAAFGSAAAAYDQSGVDFFQLFARRLVEHLNPQPGWHVVDVGAGRGAVVFPLVDAVGPTGRVTGVDIAQPMVDALAADLRARGIDAAEVRQGDAESLDLPESSVDAVTAALVLFFLPDLARGLRAMYRVLRPGGVAAFTVFGDSDPLWLPVYRTLQEFDPGADPDVDISRPRHPRLTTPAAIVAAISAAGFRDVRVLEEIHPIHFASVEQWHDWSWSCGLRGTWLAIPEQQRPAARDAVLAAVASRRDPNGGLAEDFALRIVLARKPD